jgi:hypothetical protein
MVLQLVFTLGLSYLFAFIGTYVPDVRGFLRVSVRASFFITPIIYTPERLPEDFRFLVTTTRWRSWLSLTGTSSWRGRSLTYRGPSSSPSSRRRCAL